MNIAFFSTKPYDRRFFDAENNGDFNIHYFEPHLNPKTAKLAEGCEAVCAFVNDDIGGETLTVLKNKGIRLVALRCAGYNNVDLAAAEELGMTIARVPAYSPYAVAEHTVALLLALNRKVHRAFNRVREGNFALDGLLGFDIHGLTVGIIGTGKIGARVVDILHGFGCRILAHDPYENPDCLAKGARYVDMDALLRESDIISLHSPLTPESYHLIDKEAIAKMKDGVVIINTSRGALIDSKAIIKGLKSGKIGHLGLDVYEEEGDLFFEDLSSQVIKDDVFARLMTFPNVIITGHQAFFTKEALTNIASVTLGNIGEFMAESRCQNCLQTEIHAR
jgi:D-lactate dehydrogenase